MASNRNKQKVKYTETESKIWFTLNAVWLTCSWQAIARYFFPHINLLKVVCGEKNFTTGQKPLVLAQKTNNNNKSKSNNYNNNHYNDLKINIITVTEHQKFAAQN